MYANFNLMKPLGFLSNGLTSVIVNDGSVVWFPLPRYDSPSVFTKLLDDEGGEFSISPEEECDVKVKYVAGTILSTTFFCKDGKAEVIDLMPIGERSLIRQVKSNIPLNVSVKPLFNYGLYKPAVEIEKDGIRFINPLTKECLALIPNTNLIQPPGLTLYLIYSSVSAYGPFTKKMIKRTVNRSIKNTLNFWRSKVPHPKNEIDVVKSTSISALLGSIYSPTGASIAAPTTSLPELEGGTRNWDYRFAWVRDSSMISEALMTYGYIVEARRVLNFLLGSLNFSGKPFLHPLYTVDGGDPPPEESLMWLSGYASSKPVRVGNAAASQVQLDVEGFFVDAVYRYYQITKDKQFIKENWNKLEYIHEWISKNWKMRDAGMWEDRGKPRHYTHSKVMMWVALDKVEKLGRVIGKIVSGTSKNKLREWIMSNCIKSGYLVRYPESSEVDAALLTLPIYGFLDVKERVFLNTLALIERDLLKDGFVKRYRKDFMGEAAHPFVLANVWLSRIYARLGRYDEARQLLWNVLRPSKGIYLLGEHIDEDKEEYTGNYPQMFVHAQLLLAIKEIKDIDKDISTGKVKPLS